MGLYVGVIRIYDSGYSFVEDIYIQIYIYLYLYMYTNIFVSMYTYTHTEGDTPSYIC